MATIGIRRRKTPARAAPKQPVTAANGKFSIDRIKDPAVASPRANDLAVVERVDVVDERTFVFNLSEPFTPLLAFLGVSMNVIVPQHVVEATGDLQNVVVGSGPFRFVESIPQTRLVLTRFENHWGRDAAGNFYAAEDSPYNVRDVEKARALLAEAGYPNGFEFEFYITSTYDFLRDPAEIIQANLAEIGVTANIKLEDWSIFLPNYVAGDFTVLVSGSSGQTDPDAFLYTPFFSAASTNYGKIADARVDELLLAGRQEPDPEARREIYREAQVRLLELSPHVFLFHSAQYAAHGPKVAGYDFFPNGSYIGFRNIWLGN